MHRVFELLGFLEQALVQRIAGATIAHSGASERARGSETPAAEARAPDRAAAGQGHGAGVVM